MPSQTATLEQEISIERPSTPAPRTARPAVWFAVLGAVFVAEMAYVFAAFIAGGPSNVTAGPSQVPWYMSLTVHGCEVLWGLIALFFTFKLVIRPLIRREPLSWDGLMFLAFYTLLWQDYGLDWFVWWSGYNAVAINLGSWYDSVAFWLPTNSRHGFAEIIILGPAVYGLWAAATIWFCFIMRQIKKRFPSLSNVGLFFAIFGFLLMFDLAFETTLIRGGMYHYAGAPRGWHLLFEGHYYQFPLLEMVLFAGCMALCASVRYFRNDKGRSVAERGIDEVRVGRRGKTFVRWLALAGIFNALLLVYNLAWQPVILRYGGNWPADVQKRSYFVQGMCGEKVNRACSGPGVPFGGPKSAYLNNQGELEYPAGWEAPITRVPLED